MIQWSQQHDYFYWFEKIKKESDLNSLDKTNEELGQQVRLKNINKLFKMVEKKRQELLKSKTNKNIEKTAQSIAKNTALKKRLRYEPYKKTLLKSKENEAPIKINKPKKRRERNLDPEKTGWGFFTLNAGRKRNRFE
jgi:hypothetical protein